MERLTNRGKNGEIWIADNDETRIKGRKETAYEKLAEYEDSEEWGKLLILPCAVGSTVYGIRRYSYCPTGICRSEKSCMECRESAPYEIYKKKFKIDDLQHLGKTVFLTLEEAKVALEGKKRRLKDSM